MERGSRFVRVVIHGREEIQNYDSKKLLSNEKVRATEDILVLVLGLYVGFDGNTITTSDKRPYFVPIRLSVENPVTWGRPTKRTLSTITLERVIKQTRWERTSAHQAQRPYWNGFLIAKFLWQGLFAKLEKNNLSNNPPELTLQSLMPRVGPHTRLKGYKNIYARSSFVQNTFSPLHRSMFRSFEFDFVWFFYMRWTTNARLRIAKLSSYVHAMHSTEIIYLPIRDIRTYAMLQKTWGVPDGRLRNHLEASQLLSCELIHRRCYARSSSKRATRDAAKELSCATALGSNRWSIL